MSSKGARTAAILRYSVYDQDIGAENRLLLRSWPLPLFLVIPVVLPEAPLKLCFPDQTPQDRSPPGPAPLVTSRSFGQG